MCVQGNIGVLDVSEGSYCTLMRSHSAAVQCVSVTSEECDVGGSVCMVSCSLDHTLRVWEINSGKQVLKLSVIITVISLNIVYL